MQSKSSQLHYFTIDEENTIQKALNYESIYDMFHPCFLWHTPNATTLSLFLINWATLMMMAPRNSLWARVFFYSNKIYKTITNHDLSPTPMSWIWKPYCEHKHRLFSGFYLTWSITEIFWGRTATHLLLDVTLAKTFGGCWTKSGIWACNSCIR